MELLLTSELSPDVPVSEVGRVFSAARKRSEAFGISGFLIFDGCRFCQFLEGEAWAVAAEANRVRTDPRHANPVERFRRERGGPRRYERWHLGYALAQELDACMSAQGPLLPNDASDPAVLGQLFARLTARPM